jgi:hypothetical protein
MKFVVCTNNKDYLASLELHKIYRVLPDKDAAADGDLRVIDESGEDYLYSADRFVPLSVPDAVQKSLLKAE